MELIMPYFVVEGADKCLPIKSMPGIFRLSADNLIKDVKEANRLGIRKVLLFGTPKEKDEYAAGAYREDGVVQGAIRAIKKNVKGITVITDVCLCGYATHGHCGVIKAQSAKFKVQSGVTGPQMGVVNLNIYPLPLPKRQGERVRVRGLDSNESPSSSSSPHRGEEGLEKIPTLTDALQSEVVIDNKETLKILARVALSHAEAGADWVAPSAMAKYQVKAIRTALDNKGCRKTKILGYSAKFASNFYGPFREAVDSAPKFGDRSGYQLGFADSKIALKEIADDIKEGADIVMVKPALAYMDIIRQAKDKFNAPLAAYNVSGEYSFVKFGAKAGLWDEKKMVFEIITAIKRAGADWIISYHAKDIAKWLKK